jgi:trans-aconitate methyltransferase
MKSITYWHPKIYSLLMRISYGKGYIGRYTAIRDLIPNSSSVIDVCCGDCKIYSYLLNKDINYTGVDFNPYFVKEARRKGINARLFDINKEEIPRADYILMQASLYQFFPYQHEILEKLFKAASKSLILSEPIKNKTHSTSKIISFLGVALNNPGDGIKGFRFNLLSLKEVLAPFQKNI